ncbi:MAG TPA: ester cyclase [Methanotrichaceae archaeon]|nr:ester cyclase [Methanotrichaceae archaeon]
MSLESNKALVRRFLEEVPGKGNLSVVDDLALPSLVLHVPLPEQTPGAEGMKDIAFVCRNAFPDMKITLEDMIAEGDRVACRFTTTGTNSGQFMGLPPTGRKISLSGIEIFRIEDGKIAEIWGQADLLGLMQQLGVTPQL